MASTDYGRAVVEYDHNAAAVETTYKPDLPGSPCFLVHDSKFRELISDTPSIELIQERKGDKFAHEAGVYIKSTNSEYFTSNYQTGKTIETYSLDCNTREIKELHIPDVINPNGACNYQDKVLFCAQGDLTHPSALAFYDPGDSSTSILLTNFLGRPFNSLNDVVIHHPTGDIYFTDPCYGYHQAFRPPPQLPSQVYRFRPSTGQVWCIADGFVECNGLCFSPDYSKMYVTDTGAVQAHATPFHGTNFSFNPKLPGSIYEFDVVEGRLANRKMFAFCDAGVPDGIKCDAEGNVYSGCGDGIQVWDAQGTLLGKIWTGSTVGNFNFAKDGIWAFGEERLYFIKLAARGALVQVECE
ncbi:hypothetical protein B0A48_14417 [Cryoendolithus antarcticus]|uniref:SMP-30/Gluconolactonase/LRE-like region domain-containing protein n=1 Tax=Cryoendolithus antarcticus TaxID=1507870 RepID=A0A1V8SKH0_9PEZI|nr:hypothetical protein B0A48_14417 [Cryoendolithus antarcticus]